MPTLTKSQVDAILDTDPLLSVDANTDVDEAMDIIQDAISEVQDDIVALEAMEDNFQSILNDLLFPDVAESDES